MVAVSGFYKLDHLKIQNDTSPHGMDVQVKMGSSSQMQDCQLHPNHTDRERTRD